MDKDSFLEDLLVVTKLVIAGKAEIISACREINRLRCELKQQDNEVFYPIVAIESESDHFQLENMPDSQKVEYQDFVADVRQDVIDCCLEIQRVFSKNDSQPPPASP